MTRVGPGTSVWRLGFPLLLFGCGPDVTAFDVQPRRVCAGDTVHITWKVRGTPRVEAARRTEDSVDIIRYTLVAEAGGKRVSRAVDVITYTPGVPKVLVGGTNTLGKDSLVARDSAPAAPWHSLVRVGDVVSDSGRALRVRHAGREAVVGPGREPNPAWRGLPVSGIWEMVSGLKRGEVIGHPKRHPPARLSLKVGLECATKGAQPHTIGS
ncbi:MAG TPA: hypothetical protein VFU23_06215 [Gemmatimonadales bacterium]|nr:hypothetical protein [Gemmatimonadales bacterium]